MKCGREQWRKRGRKVWTTGRGCPVQLLAGADGLMGGSERFVVKSCDAIFYFVYCQRCVTRCVCVCFLCVRVYVHVYVCLLQPLRRLKTLFSSLQPHVSANRKNLWSSSVQHVCDRHTPSPDAVVLSSVSISKDCTIRKKKN